MQHNCGNHSTFESITGDISASDHGVPSSHEIRKRVSTSEQDLEAKLLWGFGITAFGRSKLY